MVIISCSKGLIINFNTLAFAWPFLPLAFALFPYISVIDQGVNNNPHKMAFDNVL